MSLNSRPQMAAASFVFPKSVHTPLFKVGRSGDKHWDSLLLSKLWSHATAAHTWTTLWLARPEDICSQAQPLSSFQIRIQEDSISILSLLGRKAYLIYFYSFAHSFAFRNATRSARLLGLPRSGSSLAAWHGLYLPGSHIGISFLLLFSPSSLLSSSQGWGRSKSDRKAKGLVFL